MSKRTLKKKWSPTGREGDYDEIDELDRSIEELEIQLSKQKNKRNNLKRNIKKTLSKASTMLRKGFDSINFDRKCDEDEFINGIIFDNMICSKTYHGDYRWRAIGNPGDIHNHRRGRQRNSPSIEDEIYKYEQRSVNPYKNKERAALTIQDTPYVRRITKPRIFREAEQSYDNLPDIEEELDDYQTPEEEFDDYHLKNLMMIIKTLFFINLNIIIHHTSVYIFYNTF